MHGFRNLMRQWDRESPATAEAPPSPSPLGNINGEALPDCFTAAIFPRSDPRFALGLEQGIRDLVLTLVNGCGWATYLSCEGHRRFGETPCRRRDVGLVARNAQEYKQMFKTLNAAVLRSNRSHAASRIGALASYVAC